ncbi:hypothetical protein [Streptomyces antarcticus]|uniref:hypothetical protein n=1 Tax=Streptomyces antarcticus TaxID=2996458 RepID=UPI00226F1AA4|nr:MULTISPECIES: hypothetical protein [unclassified Streptomyces]MCY0941887.1 hypothetical protein [Streptomyces sp. H34-AA3]MCZ4082840.1 hypothetical protein [Streptomyces sp. H34-S5]
MTEAVAAVSPNKFKIGLTFKAAAGYDAEWITPTVFGQSAEEVATNAVDLMRALADKGVIELASHAAKKVRETHQPTAGKGGNSVPKTFQGGKVQSAAPSAPGDDSCPHGRTMREGQGKNGAWAALFCNAPKGSNCDPLWRQKDGSFS